MRASLGPPCTTSVLADQIVKETAAYPQTELIDSTGLNQLKGKTHTVAILLPVEAKDIIVRSRCMSNNNCSTFLFGKWLANDRGRLPCSIFIWAKIKKHGLIFLQVHLFFKVRL